MKGNAVMDKLMMGLFIVMLFLMFIGRGGAGYIYLAIIALVVIYSFVEGIIVGNAYGVVAICLLFAYLGHVVTKK